MTKKRGTMKLAFWIAALLMSVAVHAQTYKVVFDLTTGDLATFKQRILDNIGVVETYYAEAGNDVKVGVVIHGGAYKFFFKDPTTKDASLRDVAEELQSRLRALHERYGVEFMACSAGMKRQGVGAEALVPFVRVVPTAVTTLIDYQNKGYAYLPIH